MSKTSCIVATWNHPRRGRWSFVKLHSWPAVMEQQRKTTTSVKDSVCTDLQRVTAIYPAGCAAYVSSDHEGANGLYQKLLKVSPSDDNEARQLKRTEMRIKEAEKGTYDFVSIAKEVSALCIFTGVQ